MTATNTKRNLAANITAWVGAPTLLLALLAGPTASAQQSTPTPGTITPGTATATRAATTPQRTATPGGATATAVPRPGVFADEAFRTTWNRTDLLVSDGRVARSWYWGPRPNTGALQEDYAEGPGGKHLVQYFDKSRMEINNPNADKNNPFYVTNGLLAIELITGRVQTGNNEWVDRYSAQIPLASDTDDANAPTYASFRDVRRTPATNRIGAVVNQKIDRDGFTSADTSFDQFNVKNAYFEAVTQHNIPDIFSTFLNESGPVVLPSGTVRHARLSDPYFYVTGYPITEAYWARVKIEGKEDTPVLVQAYERRVLTYVPSLPEGFKVQMGNIGQHYYDWRYKNAGLGLDVPLGCANFLSRNVGIGKLWYDNVQARRQLGCPSEEGARTATVVRQQFERGQMLGLIVPAPDGSTQKTIYVLYEDGTAQVFPDTYVDGSPLPTAETPPLGYVAPERGFGKVWYENAQVRQRLGWGVSIEQSYPGSFYLPFERGIVTATGSGTAQVYAIYDERGLSYTSANRWVLYTLEGVRD